MGEMTAGSKAGSEVTTGAASTEKRVEKVADALLFAFIATVQLLAMPLHAPPQPEKPQVGAGLAIRVTWVPVEKLALQVEPQSIVAGELITVPPGVPMTETDSEGESVKVAGSLSAEFMVSVQVLALPLRAPPQPVKIQPLAGVSVKVTSVPESKAALQVVGQLTPLGELVTVPPSASLPRAATCRRETARAAYDRSSSNVPPLLPAITAPPPQLPIFL
jgi:hypothetical protein